MLKRIALIAAVVVVVAVGAVAWLVFRTPETASAPIRAIPLDQQATSAAAAPAATSPAATSAPAATSEPAATDAPAATAPAATSAATQSPATSEAATTAPAATSAPAAANSPTVFEIVQAESEARFIIEEVLRGAPTTVVGKTDQVAGQIEIDPNNPSTARLGVIQVNARTLATDNDFRNRAIKNAILQTDSNEFITFTPTGITGLPTTGTVGTASTFQVTGDLTIKNVTKPVTFEVSVTPTSTSRIEGTATTTVNYRDFELAIPDSPAVDTVADEVRLELQFVAQPAA